MLQKWVSVLILCFFVTSILGPDMVRAEVLMLPEPGTMVGPSPAFMPVLIKGLKVHPENPLLFDFIVDAGKSGLKTDSAAFKAESEKLIKYFLTSLTVKENDLWVNLSPYEKDRVTSTDLEKTGLGADMLAQDYILKQLAASMIHPDKDMGKVFWQKVYVKAQEKFGSTDIPVDTFNKVWITADRAKVLERNNAVFVVDAHLKVMLESDYQAAQQALDRVLPPAALHSSSLALRANEDLASGVTRSSMPDTQELSRQIIREIVIPAIEQEVNEGKNFAPLRQIFYSMILSTWFQTSLKDAFLNQVYSNKAKTGGMLADDPQVKEKIYARYLEAYKKGVFNLIKEDVANGQPVPRKYFSGGIAQKFQIPHVLHTEQAKKGDVIPVDNAAIVAVDMTRQSDQAQRNGAYAAQSGNSGEIQAYERLRKAVFSPYNNVVEQEGFVMALGTMLLPSEVLQIARAKLLMQVANNKSIMFPESRAAAAAHVLPPLPVNGVLSSEARRSWRVTLDILEGLIVSNLTTSDLAKVFAEARSRLLNVAQKYHLDLNEPPVMSLLKPRPPLRPITLEKKQMASVMGWLLDKKENGLAMDRLKNDLSMPIERVEPWNEQMSAKPKAIYSTEVIFTKESEIDSLLEGGSVHIVILKDGGMFGVVDKSQISHDDWDAQQPMRDMLKDIANKVSTDVGDALGRIISFHGSTYFVYLQPVPNMLMTRIVIANGDPDFKESDFAFLYPIGALLEKLGRSAEEFSSLARAVAWLNGPEPLRICMDIIKKERPTHLMLDQSLLSLSEAELKKYAGTIEGRELKRTLLTRLFPGAAPEMPDGGSAPSFSMTVFGEKESIMQAEVADILSMLRAEIGQHWIKRNVFEKKDETIPDLGALKLNSMFFGFGLQSYRISDEYMLYVYPRDAQDDEGPYLAVLIKGDKKWAYRYPGPPQGNWESIVKDIIHNKIPRIDEVQADAAQIFAPGKERYYFTFDPNQFVLPEGMHSDDFQGTALVLLRPNDEEDVLLKKIRRIIANRFHHLALRRNSMNVPDVINKLIQFRNKGYAAVALKYISGHGWEFYPLNKRDNAERTDLQKGFDALRKNNKENARMYFEKAVQANEPSAREKWRVLQEIANQWRGDADVAVIFNKVDKLWNEYKNVSEHLFESGVHDSKALILQQICDSYHDVIKLKKPELLQDAQPQDQAEEISGGIDFKLKYMPLDVVKEGKGVTMLIDTVMMEQFRREDFTGIVPVIIHITPITSVMPVLEL